MKMYINLFVFWIIYKISTIYGASIIFAINIWFFPNPQKVKIKMISSVFNQTMHLVKTRRKQNIRLKKLIKMKI